MAGPTLLPAGVLVLAGVLLCGVLLHRAGRSGPRVSPPADRPNFIIILADDMGWGDLGANQPWERETNTPNLDLLALQGMSGVSHNFSPDSLAGLPLSEVALPRLLQESGYHTALIGKWHLGHRGPHAPTSRGFDYYLGIPYSNDMGCTDIPGYDLPSQQPCSAEPRLGLPLLENRSIVEQPLDLWTLTQRYREAALRTMHSAAQRKQPYLLYVAMAHMHVPLAPPLASPSTNDADGGRGVYAASLREMDDLVGALKRAADETGLNNTLFWFTASPGLESDVLDSVVLGEALHGAINAQRDPITVVLCAGDNGPWEKKCQYAGSVGPFTGTWQTSRGGGSAKQTTWEGGHRVPTVAYWPGRIPANTTSSALLSGMDIFPTLLSLAGLRPPGDRPYDGIDASDVLLNGSHTGHEFLFHPNSGAAGRFGDLQTVRAGKHKAFYITGAARACGGGGGAQQTHDPPLIFDLSVDRAEATPLDEGTAEYREVLDRVSRAREELLWDVATDPSVSTADYSKDQSAAPCCDPRSVACRCPGPD